MSLRVDIDSLPPLPRPWPDEHDDGTKTYTRAEVLVMVAQARSVGPFERDEDGRRWAVVMLDTYDGAR